MQYSSVFFLLIWKYTLSITVNIKYSRSHIYALNTPEWERLPCDYAGITHRKSMGRKDTKISINPWLHCWKQLRIFLIVTLLDQYLGKKRMRKFYDYVILYTFHLRNLINGMKYLPIYLTFNCYSSRSNKFWRITFKNKYNNILFT